MSRRRPPPPLDPPAPPVALEPDDPPDDPLEELDEPELVEYLVLVVELSWVVTSVPNSVHSSQTSSSAPSILTVFGAAVSVPHISH
jgi:hypothetical protein